MGLIFSLLLAFSGLMTPESPEYGKATMFISTVVLGMIYGPLIQLITSLPFNAKMER